MDKKCKGVIKMQLVVGIILIFGVIHLFRNRPTNLSFNARIGIFTLVAGIVLKGISSFFGSTDTYSYSSPSFFYTVLSGASTLAFIITILCFLIGLYKFLFERN